MKRSSSWKLLTACLLFSVAVILQFEPAWALSILQGATDQTTTQINILRKDNDTLVYWLEANGGRWVPANHHVSSHPSSNWVTDTVFFRYLAPEETYTLFVANASGDVVDSRTLNTARRSGESARMALVSCMNDRYAKEQVVMWDTVSSTKPDLLLYLGDNNYSAFDDPRTPAEMWDGYVQSRLALKIYTAPHLIPILATWDDHDYGVDNGNATYPYKEQVKEIFESFYAQKELVPWIRRGPGVARSIDVLGQRFVFLDGRSFQSPKKAPLETFFGLEQEAWMAEEVLTSTRPTWLINGTILFGRHQFGESIERSHKTSFKRFVETLRKATVPLVFASGDVHFSQVVDLKSVLGFPAYEFTSSALHSIANPIAWLPNFRRKALAMGHNFLMAETTNFDGSFKIDITSLAAKGKRRFSLRNLMPTAPVNNTSIQP